MPAQLLSYQCPHCGHLVEVDASAGDKIMTCPAEGCGKPFHLEIPTAKPVPTLIVPPSVHDDDVGNGPTLHDRLSALTGTAQPAVAEAPQEAPEQEVLTIRPLMFRRYPFRFLGYSLLTLVGLGVLAYGLIHSYHALTVLGIVMVGFGGFRLLAWALRTKSTWLKVTNRRIILHAGALEAHSTEISFKDVTDIQAHQNLFNRMLAVGDLTLFTRIVDKKEILVMAVPDPEGVASRMRQLRQP